MRFLWLAVGPYVRGVKLLLASSADSLPSERGVQLLAVGGLPSVCGAQLSFGADSLPSVCGVQLSLDADSLPSVCGVLLLLAADSLPSSVQDAKVPASMIFSGR